MQLSTVYSHKALIKLKDRYIEQEEERIDNDRGD